MKSLISSKMFPFVDPIGRVSDKPFDQEDGVTDNPLLFTGEVVLLLKLLGELGKPEIAAMDEILMEVEVVPGLFRRQPEKYQLKYNIPRNAVSHDEYNGVCFFVAACPEYFRTYANDIIKYGQYYGWQYNDIAPRANFFQALKDRFFQTLKELKAFTDDVKANPQNTNAVDLRHPQHIIALGQFRQPRDRAFYKIAAALEPTLFEITYLSIATVFSSMGPALEHRGGTKLMAWFRILAIEELKYDNFLLRMAHKLFRRNLTKKLGTEYPTKLILSYFDRLSANKTRHPMIDLVDQYVKACIKSKSKI